MKLSFEGTKSPDHVHSKGRIATIYFDIIGKTPESNERDIERLCKEIEITIQTFGYLEDHSINTSNKVNAQIDRNRVCLECELPPKQFRNILRDELTRVGRINK